MFFSLFSSENQKFVKKWKQEHEEIVLLAHKVIEEYSTNDHKAAKKALVKLNKITVHHIMIEDIELHKIHKCEERGNEALSKSIDEFHKTFHDTKVILMDFLTKYTHPEEELDANFIHKFQELVDVLSQRIEFEENNLYNHMGVK